MNASPTHEGSDNLYHSALYQSPYITCICTENGKLLFANRAAEHAFGNDLKNALRQIFTHSPFNKSIQNHPITIHNRKYSIAIAPLAEDGKLLLITFTEQLHEQISTTEKEKYLIDFQQMTRLGTWKFDGRSDLYTLSDEIYQIMGVDRSEYPNVRLEDFFHFVHPEDRPSLAADFQKIIEGQVGEVKFRMHINGELKWMKVISWSLMDEHGEFIGSHGIIQDVTELEIREEQLNEKERLYHALGKIARISGWQYDLKSNKAKLTASFKSLLKIPEENEVPDLPELLERIPKDIRPIFNELYEEVLAGGKPVSIETKIKDYENNWIWVLINAEGVVKDNKCVEVRGTMQDVSYGKIASVYSAQNEALLKEAQRVSKIGSWVLNLDTDRVKWSDTMFEIFEMEYTESHEIHSADYINLIHPEDRHKIKADHVLVKPDGTRGYQYRVITKKGTIKHVYNTEGQRLGDSNKLFGTVQDITYLVESEQKIEEIKAALNEKLKAENFLAQISMRFNSLSSLKDKINQALEDIALHTGASSVFIFEDTDDKKMASKTFEWKSQPAAPQESEVSLLYEAFPLWQLLEKNDYLQLSNIKDLPAEAKKILQEDPSNDVLLIPLTSGKKQIGFMGLCGYEAQKDWKGLILLQLIGKIISDAIHRRNMEEALIKREAELREVQQLASISRFEADLIEKNVCISDEFASISGLDPDWQPTKKLLKIMHKDDLNEGILLFRKCLETKRNFNFTSRIFNAKTKEEKSIISRGYVVYNQANLPIKYIGTVQDITESVAQKRKIEETNSQLENILHQVPGAVYRRKSAECVDCRFLNRQVNEVLGYTGNELKPHGPISFFSLVHEHDRDMLKKKISESLKNESSYEITFRVKDKAENERWIWDRGDYVFAGSERYIQGIMVDITSRIKAEDRILSATLQAEDVERRRIAKEINDNVQQLLVSSMFSLQSLEPYIHLAKDHSILERYQKGLAQLKEGIGETKAIAYNIMPKSIEDFGLVNTLDSMIQLLNKNTDINFTFYSNLNERRLSEKTETSIYRICREAVNNIIAYSQASEASIQLTIYEDNLSLVIEDDGKGFDTEEQNLLYTGFGISYMKSRANAVGGTFELDSTPGRGSTIAVVIPNYKDLKG